MKITMSVLLLVLCSCSRDPIATERTNNSQIQDEILFQKDGYTVHRFFDNGRAIYWVVPSGQTYSEWTEYCGKNCITIHRQFVTTLK